MLRCKRLKHSSVRNDQNPRSHQVDDQSLSTSKSCTAIFSTDILVFEMLQISLRAKVFERVGMLAKWSVLAEARNNLK